MKIIRNLILIVPLLCMVKVNAYDFFDNGFYYNIKSNIDKTVEVTNSSNNLYTGDIVIPTKAVHEGLSYNVVAIGQSAFNNSSDMKSIFIPNSIDSIFFSAFSRCNGLEKVIIEDSKSDIHISQLSSIRGAFLDSPLDSVYIGRNINFVYSGHTPFSDNQSLRAVTFSEYVTRIGKNQFAGCTGLESVNGAESIIELESSAFSRCKSMNGFIAGPNLKSIGMQAFVDCSSLTSLELKENLPLTYIGSDAFNNCGITGEVCIMNIEDIDLNIFWNCNLSSLRIGANVNNITGQIKLDNLKKLIFDDSPDTLTWQMNRYLYMSNVEDVYMGRQIEISSSPFSGKTNLKTFTFGDYVTSMMNTMFYGCTNLVQVKGGSKITEIPNEAFYKCTNIETIDFLPNVESFGNSCFAYSGLSGTVNLDSCKEIGSSAFQNCPNIETVILGDNISNIKENTFQDCTGLKKMILPDVAFDIPIGFCRNCTSLCEVNLSDKITSFGSNCFYKCPLNLDKLTINPAVTLIKINSFSGTTNISELVIPYSENTIELESGWIPDTAVKNLYLDRVCQSSPFTSMSGLNVITIGDNITEIGSNFFKDCTSLEEVNLGNTIQTIGNSAFRNCANIKDIVFPESLNYIDRYAFQYVDFEKINCMAITPPSTGGDPFSTNTYQSAELIVPEESLDSYKNTLYWKNFTNTVSDKTSDIIIISDELSPKSIQWFDLEGNRVDNPTKGLYIKVTNGIHQKVLLK